MSFKNTISLLLIFLCSSFVSANNENILSGKYSQTELESILIPRSQWTPFPSINDREAWAAADEEMLANYISQAEKLLTYRWPSLPATSSLLIVRTGNRTTYEEVLFEKRIALGTLLLGEIAENKGRFVDQIIDGIWSICEESWWGAPAHLPKTAEYAGLADVNKPFAELFSAETGSFLAWVDYFLRDKLDAVSPQIHKRIYHEVNTRLMQPLMNNHYTWMSVDKRGRKPNNWNPWISSNWVSFVLLLEEDQKVRSEMVAKILQVLDGYVNPYPEDGGCDEGPSYWEAATASLYDNMALLNLASNDAFSYAWSNPKIKNMGEYIYRAQISEKYFINFADADPQPKVAGSLIYRFGRDMNNPQMQSFGAYYSGGKTAKIRAFYFFRNLFTLFSQKEMEKYPKKLPLPQDVWFSDLQAMIARDTEGKADGFFVAAKGGHNNESHNHNDIGSFIVYYDGQPLIIDVGRGTYTLRTFNEKRYELWNNCSDYHNLPTINGVTQVPGVQYKATNVSHKAQKNSTEFTLDISKAYGSDAGINSWKREIKLNRKKNVEITDVSDLKLATSVEHHFMTCYPAQVLENESAVLIEYKTASGERKDLVIKYDAKKMTASTEKIQLTSPEDVGIKTKWGDTIHRINFKTIDPQKQETYKFFISTRK